MSKRLYPNAAEKQRAYRKRLRANGAPPTQTLPAKPKQRSRPQRLAAIEEAVHQLADEYQQWLDHIPENLAAGSLAADLQDVITELEEIANALSAIDPPRIGQ